MPSLSINKPTLTMPSMGKLSPRLSKAPAGVAGLDVDGAFLAAAVLRDGAIAKMASAPLEPGIASDGEVRDPVALSKALKDLFAAHELPRRVRLGVANQQIVVRQLEMPLIADSDDREAAIRFQAAEAIAMPLDEAILDYRSLGEVVNEEGGKRERLLVVAARQSMVEKLVSAVKGAGLKPEGLDLNAFALVRMFGRGDDATGPAIDDTAQVLCHFGGVTNLAIASGSACLFTRPLQTLWQGDEAAIGALVEEIRLSVDFYMAQPEAKPVGSIVLSGPGAHDELLATELPARSGLPVTVAEPLGTLSDYGVPAGDDPFRFTVAAGLAMGELA